MVGTKRKSEHPVHEVIELLDSDEEGDIVPLAFMRAGQAGATQVRQSSLSQSCNSQDPALSQGVTESGNNWHIKVLISWSECACSALECGMWVDRPC